MSNSDGKIWFSIELDTAQLTADVERAKKQVAMIGVAAKDSANSFEKAFRNAGGLVAGYLGTQALGGLIKQIVTVRGEFQQLGVAFTTMLGSKEKANQLMAQMVDTAAKTPFTLQQVAAGAKQLLAYQVAQEDVNGTLIRLGNIASGLGVPMDRLILVYGQVKAKGRLMGDDLRQFTEAGVPIIHELAKSMGVADTAITKMVTNGQIGFPAVQKVIENMTDKGGMFFNLMESQSKTVTGQISNLQDAISRMFNSIGESNEGIINKSIASAGFLIDHYQAIGKILMTLVATYGAYRTALIVSSLMEARKYSMTAAEVVLNFSKVASLSTMTYAQQAETVATSEATVAQLRLNLAVMANPYVIAAAAIIGLVAAFVLMADSSSSAERAQQSLNDYTTKATETANALKSKTTDLVSVINSETASRYQQVKAFDALKVVYPGLFDNLDMQAFKTMTATEQQRLLNEEMDKQASVKMTGDIAVEKKKLVSLQSSSGQTVNYSNYGDTNAAADLKAIETQKQFIANLERQKLLNDEAAHDAQVLNMPVKERLVYYNTMVDLLKKQRDETEKMAQTDFTKGVLGNLSKQIDDFIGKVGGLNATLPKIGTKAYWEGEQKAAEESLEKMNKSDVAWKGFIEKRNTAIAKLKMWDFDSKAENKSVAAAKKLAEEKVKIQKEIAALETSEASKEIDQKFENIQEGINLMEDGYAKQMAQLKLNNEKRTEEIKRARESELKIEQEIADKKWELTAKRDKEGKVIGTNPNHVSLSAETSGAFDQAEKNNSANYAKEKGLIAEKLRLEYASFDDKRREIDKKYQADSVQINATFTGDELQTKLTGLESWHKAALQTISANEAEAVMSTSALFIQLFGDASTKSVADIRKIADESNRLYDYLKKEAPENIQDKTFGGVIYTEEQLKAIQSDSQKMADFKAQIDALIHTAQTGETTFGKFGVSVKQFFDNVGKDKNTVGQQQQALEGLQGTFQSVSFYAGMATDLLNAISTQEGDLADSAAKSIGAVMDIASTTMQGFEQGGWVGAAIAFVTSVATKVFQAEKLHQQALKKLQDEKTAQQKEYNDLLLKQNELLEKAVTIFGTDSFSQAMGYANVADKYRNASSNATSNLSGAQVQTGSHKTGLFGWGGEKADYSSLLATYPKLIDGQGNLNKELAQSILDNESLDDTSKKALQSALDYSKEYEDALKSMDDYLKSVFGTLGGDMMTAIVANLGNAQNAVEDFGKAASKTIGKLLEDIAYSLFLADDFIKLQADTKAVMESTLLTPDEKAAATAKLMDNFVVSVGIDSAKANDWLTKWKEKNPGYFGDTATTRTGASKGLESISQDTAVELNGRFTAIQGHTFEINESVKMLASNSSKVLDTLMGIKSDTFRLANIETGIGSMKQTLDIFNIKGIAIRP